MAWAVNSKGQASRIPLLNSSKHVLKTHTKNLSKITLKTSQKSQGKGRARQGLKKARKGLERQGQGRPRRGQKGPRQGQKGKAKKGLGKARRVRPQPSPEKARGGWPDNKGETPRES